MDYVFMTDSDSDLPYALKQEYDIPVVYMPYALNGKEYFDDLGQMLDHKSYFDKMREGAVPVTSALNEAAYYEYFEPVLESGKDLLFVAFSSKLSRTIESVYAVQKELLQKYPERKFIVVDTLSISGAMTVLLLKAHELYRAGKPIEEVADWLEKNKLRSHAHFMVEDLKYLKRGGRISPTAAAFGSMLDIKPLICEARDGTLNAYNKVRGRKKGFATLVDDMMSFEPDPAESFVLIINADDRAGAEQLRDLVLQRNPAFSVRIENIGPVIGAHCGPGTLAVCFLGKKERKL
ncbi:MAG: DegV family protein [Clostridia bacterium]|nr:DegV family protein [Clostridia bacterium]